MSNKIISSAAGLVLCVASLSPGLAQDYRFVGFDPPRGASTTVNLRIPLGGRPGARSERTTVSLTGGYGWQQPGAIPGERGAVRQLDLLDFRVDRGSLERARLAGFELRSSAHDRLQIDDSVDDKKATTIYALIFILLVGAGYILSRGDGPARTVTPPSEGDSG